MTTLAIVRPSDWEVPLFVHVLGAMLLVGGLVVVAVSLLLARRRAGEDAAALAGLAYRTLFLLVLPAFVAMRIGAQWVVSETGYDESDPDWVGVGYVTSDLGAVLLVGALVVAGIALRGRAARGAALARVVMILSLLLIAAYVVAIWAMTTKPT
ncbi:MAG: hypothetical protein M3229_02280 [Actinomycetota bacterium]|nr:hypothetical protein [Actinomycetota bacterium]